MIIKKKKINNNNKNNDNNNVRFPEIRHFNDIALLPVTTLLLLYYCTGTSVDRPSLEYGKKKLNKYISK